MNQQADSALSKRLRWRCRRGLKELDVMLERFLDSGFNQLSVEQQTHFAQFLEEQDLDLLEWLTGKSEPTEPEYSDLIATINAAESSNSANAI